MESQLAVEEIEAKIREIFQSQNPDEKLERFLAEVGRAKLTVLTKAMTIATSECSDESSTHELGDSDRLAASVLKTILRLIIRSYQVNSEEVTDLTCCVLNGAANFSTGSLSCVVTHCLEYLKSHEDADVPMLWLEVFGRIVSILSSRKDIDFDNDIVSGKELRTSLVNHICRLKWGASNAPYLIGAFREFPELDSVEIDIVVHNAVESMKVMDPSAVPPVAHHLLSLCGDKRPGVLLQNFDEYFRGVIFKEPGPLSSQASATTSQLKRKSLGTVVFHFIQAARHSPALIKEVVRRIKNSRVDHKLIMTPFMISVSMGLTCIEYFKPQIVEGLKRSIVTNLADIQNGESSAWYRKARGDVQDTFMDCFRSVIDAKSSELDFMLDGLKDLALKLLSIDASQAEHQNAIERCWSLGSYIICAIVKKHNDFFNNIIDDLLKNKRSIVHINCLASCLRSMIRKIVQSSMSGRISELIDHLPLMTVDTATPIIKAMIPSFQLSRKLLSELIVVLRKTVYKSTEARKISAQAMILLLSNSRIIGAIPRSQYSESQTLFSQATQTQVEILGTARENESLCFEVLWILKRFFTQPSEVREQLYLGLHVVSRKNPELIKVICSHLLSQVHEHMDADKAQIKMTSLLDCSDPNNTVMNEHLGYLIQCVSYVTLRGRRIYRSTSEDQPESLISCESLLATWVDIMSSVSEEDLEMAASNLSDTTLRSLESVKEVRNALIVQVLLTIEALIEYIALRNATNDSQKIEDLFKKYLDLTALIKPVKPKIIKKDAKKTKGGGKKLKLSKKGGGNTSANQSTPTNDSQNDKENKKGKQQQEGPKPLVLVHIINMESLLEILKHLNGSTSDKLKLGQTNKFESFVLSVIKQKMERLKKKEPIGERERKLEDVVTTIASIAGALWELCRNRMIAGTAEDNTQHVDDGNGNVDEVQIVDKDDSLISLRFEVLLELVEFLVQQTSVSFQTVLQLFNFEVFDDKSFDDMFEDFFEAWSSLVTMCSGQGREPKELEHLFAILETFGKYLPSHASQSSKKVLEWCLEYAKTPKTDLAPTIELCGVVVKTILTVGSKLDGVPEKEFFKLARLAHCALGDVDDELEKFSNPDDGEHWLVNVETAPVVICSIGLYVRDNLNLLTGTIQRLKVLSQYYGIEKSEELRDIVCNLLTFLITLSTELIRSCFPSGPCVDILQSVMDQVFITTTLLTEHFIEMHSKAKMDFTSKKFINLVKLIGKDFKIRVESLITHIECIQRDNAEALIKSKKGGRVPAALKQKFTKDSKTIPSLIYHAEKYEQGLYALEQKAKVNLLAGTKLSTARDFRIEVKELKEALAENHTETQMKKKNKRDTTSVESNDSTNYSTMQQSGISNVEDAGESSSSSNKGRKSLKRKRNNK